MAQLDDTQKAAMGGPQQVALEGDSWTEGDPPVRDTIVPGTNSPEITGLGWRRMVYRMKSAKGIR